MYNIHLEIMTLIEFCNWKQELSAQMCVMHATEFPCNNG